MGVKFGSLQGKFEIVREQGAEEDIWLKRAEVPGYWSKLQNKELHNLYILPNNIRMIKMEDDEMGWTCGMCEKGEKCIQSVGAEN